MHTTRELIRLAAHKATLRRKIALRRNQCAAAATKVLQPLDWLDRAGALWQKLAPLAQLAALPLGLLMRRVVSPRFKVLTAVARWAPLAIGVLRSFKSGQAVRVTAELKSDVG
ncbi:MAG: hypothetical protein ABIZ04_08315 [Opitutus sp.]